MLAPHHVGSLIRQFRKSRNISQQSLEVAIDASFGHISRIESGKVNPSKETLLKIADFLKLSEFEISCLLGVEFERVSLEEVKTAIDVTKPYLTNSPYPTFLLDDYFYVYTWNSNLIDLFNIDQQDVGIFKGKNMFEIMYHPEFRAMFQPKRWESLVVEDLIYFMKSVGYHIYPQNQVVTEVLSTLRHQYPDFDKYWNLALQKYTEEVTPGENLIYFKQGKKEICFYMSVLNVINCPRFRIVEYILHHL